MFENNIYKGAVNGSLGTLPVELKIYLILGLCGLLTIPFERYREPVIGLIALYYLVQSFSTQSSSLGNHVQASAIILYVCFTFGMLFYICRAFIPISSTVALLLWASTLFVRGSDTAVLLYYLALSYSIFAIAFDRGIRLERFGSRGDFSYGLYLYGFPVKQALVLVIGSVGSTALFLLAFPVTFLLAWLSWRLVEWPMLKRKGRANSWLQRFRPQSPRTSTAD